MDVEPYTGNLRDGTPAQDLFSITVNYPGQPPRRFTGELSSHTWELDPRPCLYAGSNQAGVSNEVEGNDPVIEGRYSDYQVSGAFATNYMYSHFDERECMQ